MDDTNNIEQLALEYQAHIQDVSEEYGIAILAEQLDKLHITSSEQQQDQQASDIASPSSPAPAPPPSNIIERTPIRSIAPTVRDSFFVKVTSIPADDIRENAEILADILQAESEPDPDVFYAHVMKEFKQKYSFMDSHEYEQFMSVITVAIDQSTNKLKPRVFCFHKRHFVSSTLCSKGKLRETRRIQGVSEKVVAVENVSSLPSRMVQAYASPLPN